MQGPEIRTGFLENGNPVLLEQGQEVTITTDYTAKGNKNLIAMRWGGGGITSSYILFFALCVHSLSGEAGAARTSSP